MLNTTCLNFLSSSPIEDYTKSIKIRSNTMWKNPIGNYINERVENYNVLHIMVFH